MATTYTVDAMPHYCRRSYLHSLLPELVSCSEVQVQRHRSVKTFHSVCWSTGLSENVRLGVTAALCSDGTRIFCSFVRGSFQITSLGLAGGVQLNAAPCSLQRCACVEPCHPGVISATNPTACGLCFLCLPPHPHPPPPTSHHPKEKSCG